jgi:membrane protein implicated in regulation of membrane protease activity
MKGIIFLQAQTTIQKGTDTLFQYGILGLFAIIMIFVIYVLWKRVNKLEESQTQYLKEDRKEMLNVIANNTKAFEKFELLLEKE